jgi:hypothetical protein
MGVPGDRAVSKTSRQLWVLARGAVAKAEKAYAVASRVVVCGRRKPSASGCVVKGLRAVMAASPLAALESQAAVWRGGSDVTDAAGSVLPPSRMFPELASLYHVVRRAEAIVDQTTGVLPCSAGCFLLGWGWRAGCTHGLCPLDSVVFASCPHGCLCRPKH